VTKTAKVELRSGRVYAPEHRYQSVPFNHNPGPMLETGAFHVLLLGRGLHSSSFRLSVSAFCGIGGASRGIEGGV
jgi:hypothetical protein